MFFSKTLKLCGSRSFIRLVTWLVGKMSTLAFGVFTGLVGNRENIDYITAWIKLVTQRGEHIWSLDWVTWEEIRRALILTAALVYSERWTGLTQMRRQSGGGRRQQHWATSDYLDPVSHTPSKRNSFTSATREKHNDNINTHEPYAVHGDIIQCSMMSPWTSIQKSLQELVFKGCLHWVTLSSLLFL